jgi:hypothetical protein
MSAIWRMGCPLTKSDRQSIGEATGTFCEGGICGSGRPRSRGRNSQQGSNRDARQSGMEEQDRQTEQDPDADKDVPEKFHAS